MSLQLVTAAGIVIGLLYLVVVLQIFFARLRNRIRTKRQLGLERTWLPILVADTTAIPESLPPLRQRDLIPFLTLWNQLQESFTGDIKRHLNDVGRRVGIDAIAHRLLESRR